MSFRNGQQVRCFIGMVPAHAYLRSLGGSSSTDMLDTTVFRTVDNAPVRARTFIPNTDTSTFQCAGPLDTDATSNGQYDALTDLKGSQAPITILPLGTDGGAWLVDGIETDISFPTGISQTSDWSLTAQTTGATDINGVLVEDHVTVTIDTNGTALDNAAATTNGAVAHLHVTAFSGFTDDVITIEDSANNLAWATIGTFTTVTGRTSERLVIAGTVRRYVRVVDNVTGTGSITRTVALSRR